MLQSEFDRLTSRPYTEAEFSEIHYIYCYHPAVQSKKDIAELWTIGGICLIKDMWPTARRVEEAELKRNAARTAYEHGDLELTMHWQDVLLLPIGGSHGKTSH